MSSRVSAAISGALIADAFALGTHRSYNLDVIRESCHGVIPKDLRSAVAGMRTRNESSGSIAGFQTECGDELLHTLNTLAFRGFRFDKFADNWRTWAEAYAGHLSMGTREAMQNLANGVPAKDSGSHFIDLMGAIRAPALLLFAEQIDDNGLALASRELQLVSHENPMALQAGEFLVRAALKLLRGMMRPKTLAKRREAMASALHAAADSAGSQFHAVIDDAVSEAQSRDNAIAFSCRDSEDCKELDPLQAVQVNVDVLGRLTASGDQLGQEVQGGKTSYIVPAIIWFVIAYDSFPDAVQANYLLGGESAVRAIFIGLLLVARDGQRAIPETWKEQLVARPDMEIKVPAFVMPFYLCKIPGGCHVGDGWMGERTMHHVTTAAAVLPMERRGDFYVYRIFVRIDAVVLLHRQAKPSDWDDNEDGIWEPPDADLKSGQVTCLARYFQFTSSSGRHAPFGLWPSEALCQLTREAPIAHESFDVLLPERLKDLIGGVVIGSRGRMVKLPSLSVNRKAKAPDWHKLCEHIGTLRLPEGKWVVGDSPGATSF